MLQPGIDLIYRRSVERLEEMVTPMADKVDDIHKRPDSNLNGKIEDVQRWVMAYAHVNTPPPPPSARDQDGSVVGSMYSSHSSSERSERERERSMRRADVSLQTERKPYSSATPLRTPDLAGSEASSVSSPLRGSTRGSSESSSFYDGLEIGPDGRGPSSSLGSVNEQEETDFRNPVYSQRRSSRSAPRSSSRKTTQDSRRSGMIAQGGLAELEGISQPPFFRQTSKDAITQRQPNMSPDSELSMRTNSLSLTSERTSRRSPMNPSRPGPPSSSSSNTSRSAPQPYPDSIPVPARDHSEDPIPVTTPPPDIPIYNAGSRNLRSAASSYTATPSVTSGRSYSTSAPTLTGEPERASTPDQEEFEQGLFKNSAILCDLPATLVDYTLPSKDESRPWDLEMATATKEARICIVRKRNNVNDSIRFTTSIWSLAYDRSARMEQRLVDGDAIVPYSTYFSPEKVAVTIPAELRFHEANPKDPNAESRKVSTSWVNYVFHDARAGNVFQSVLFGRKLIAVFRTEKTLRVREGLKGALAYQEQMCGMENLRLWEDEGSCGVLAMMHFSAHFKDGYLSFWLNSSANPVRVREEGSKSIKIKGLDIPVEGTRGANGLVRRGSEGVVKMGIGLGSGKLGKEGKRLAGKKITGARIEFRTEEDKDDFVALVGRVQDRLVTLPDWDESSTRS